MAKFCTEERSKQKDSKTSRTDQKSNTEIIQNWSKIQYQKWGQITIFIPNFTLILPL